MTQTSTVAEFAIIERFDFRSVVFYILTDSVVWRELYVIFVVYVEPRLFWNLLSSSREYSDSNLTDSGGLLSLLKLL